MNPLEDIEGLSECIGRAIQEHLAKSNINIAWPQLDDLASPILRVEAFLEDAAPSPRLANANAKAQVSQKVASVRIPYFFCMQSSQHKPCNLYCKFAVPRPDRTKRDNICPKIDDRKIYLDMD
jgi:hypothetical protein